MKRILIRNYDVKIVVDAEHKITKNCLQKKHSSGMVVFKNINQEW
jgi:hypothetical protein